MSKIDYTNEQRRKFYVNYFLNGKKNVICGRFEWCCSSVQSFNERV